MDWKSIKTLMIILLLIVNIFFFVMLINYLKSADYIDDASIENTVALLEKSNIEISKEIIPAKKISLPSFSTEYVFDDYMVFLIERLCDGGAKNSYILPDSIEITTDAGDFLSVGMDFSLTFIDSAASEKSAELMSAEKNFSPENYLLNSENQNLIEKTFCFYGGSDTEIAATVGGVEYDEKLDMTLVKISQTVNNIPLCGQGGICALRDGAILYFSGSWCFAPAKEADYSPLYDQINILFIDKARILAQREQDNSQNIHNSSKTIINSLTNGYTIYIDNADKQLYYIPSWIIEYENDDIRIYNAVNAAEYVIN